MSKPPTEKQLAARKAFGEAARARAAAKRAEKAAQSSGEVAAIDKNCIFCGQPTTWQRLVNLQSVALCEEHYYSENVGKIAQKLRELSHA